MRLGIVLPLLAAFLLFLTAAAQAGDLRVVPGQRIGTVVLGMDRASVHTLLHAPSATRRLRNGLVLDTWLSPVPIPKSADRAYGLKRDYVTVFFQDSHAVQIEVTSPQFATADGLSTHRSADDFAKRYSYFQEPHKGPQGTPYCWWNSDPSVSSPAAKHFVIYEDAVKQGIACKYSAWGDLAPDPDPKGSLETMIVHSPGKIVLLNPNDGLPYAGTGPRLK